MGAQLADHAAEAPASETGQPGVCRACAASGRTDMRPTHRREWPWLPTQDRGTLAPHPFCCRCGRVRAVGSAPAKREGDVINLLGALDRRLRLHGLRVTQAQRRLIMRAVRRELLADGYSLTRETQDRLLASTIARYTGLHQTAVSSYLRSC